MNKATFIVVIMLITLFTLVAMGVDDKTPKDKMKDHLNTKKLFKTDKIKDVDLTPVKNMKKDKKCMEVDYDITSEAHTMVRVEKKDGKCYTTFMSKDEYNKIMGE